MDWNVSWFFLGGIAFILGIVNLICLLCKKEQNSIYLIFGSLSLGVVSVFQEVKVINQWIAHGELTLVSKNIAQIQTILSWGIIVLILLNFIDVVLLRIIKGGK